ncbi:MAG: sulfatase-like hydrolase/transferase [Bryobacterales bacterium]|nr:sulfatase-like hydrolase/transferase [Bryobacterales bacterium]
MLLRRRDLLPALSAVAATPAARRPNILFLFTDDQRIDTIGALGNPHAKTPHLDALVRTGFVFRNAYCLGANMGAVCTPSRNMLLSGQAYFRWQGPLAPGDGTNFPVAMKQLGYETYHHGKRGNTALNIQARFDHNKYLQDEPSRRSGEPGQEIVDEAIAFLGQRDQAKPFFLYLAFSGPHDPRVAAKPYMDKFDRARIPLPRNYRALHPFDNGEQLVRDELLAGFPRTEDEVRGHLHDYYAVMNALDGHIGRLLAHLKQTGQYNNTIIVFSSDHGLAMGSHGLMGKQSLYEDAMKPPLIFAGPGIKPGSTGALAYLLDIFPTVVDLAGGTPPAGLDGQSLRPVIARRAQRVRPTLFCAYRDVQRMVRDERWKLIRYPKINRSQLFDLKNDPDELHDLAADLAQQQRIASLTAEMSRWQSTLGDTAPLTAATPTRAEFVSPTPDEYRALRRKLKMEP